MQMVCPCGSVIVVSPIYFGASLLPLYDVISKFALRRFVMSRSISLTMCIPAPVSQMVRCFVRDVICFIEGLVVVIVFSGTGVAIVVLVFRFSSTDASVTIHSCLSIKGCVLNIVLAFAVLVGIMFVCLRRGR